MEKLTNAEIEKQIERLKKEKGVSIVAHFYQTLEVQKVADFIGDSLALAKIARDQIKTPYILFAAVKFMAETASILNQDKTVIMVDPSAGCPLADFLTGEQVKEAKSAHPNAPVIVYVNTTAETKAYADYCCTSSNAVSLTKKVAEKTGQNTILFGPDKNLAHFVRQQTNLEIITVPGNGNCPVHNLFTISDVKKAKQEHPGALLLVHPESPAEVCDRADYVGSTAGMWEQVKLKDHPAGYIIGTEMGLVEFLQEKYPNKGIFPLATRSVCKNMKKSTLQKVYDALQKIGTPEEKKLEVRVDPTIAQQAKKSIDAMIELS